MKKTIKEILSLAIIGFLIGAIPLVTSPLLLAQELIKPPTKNASSPGNVISLDFQDANLKDILKLFSQQSGLNFVASDAVRDKKITLYLDRVSIQDALNNIIEANQLAYKQAEGSNIFIVNEKSKEAEMATITKIYALKFARLSSSILQSSNSALAGTTTSLSGSLAAMSSSGGGGGGTGSSGGGSSSGGGFGIGGGGGGTGGGGGSASGTGKGIDRVVEKLLSSRGSLAIDERTNSLIITDIPAQFERIEAIISQLDVPTLQVIIEAEILETNQDTVDKLGIEFGGANGTIFNAAGAGTSEPFPFASRSRAIDASAQTVKLGYLSFNNLTAVMQALSTKTDTKVLARPRILTLNNESAVINITSQTAVASITQTTSAEGTAVSTSNAPERLTTGIVLTITPQINDDGYVTMLVAPEVTTAAISEFFPDQNFVDPQTRSARSLVRVKDGDTIVIGGLLKEDISKVKRKVPILGSIPLLGIPFTKMSDTIKNKELIVFITPHIIYDEKTPKKQAAAVAPAKKTETALSAAKPAKETAASKESVAKETAPAKALSPKSRDEAIERALDQLSQNNKKIPNGKDKPTDQI